MLSDTFKYISQFRHAGHQVGRKVGDMLEVLTYAALNQDDFIRQRMRIEPKLYGFSGAGHKVEFVIESQPPLKRNGGEITDASGVLGFVECKKVGVEQTVNGSFKKAFPPNTNPRGFFVEYGAIVATNFKKQSGGKFENKICIDKGRLRIISDGREVINEAIEEAHRLIIGVTSVGNLFALSNTESLRGVSESIKTCRIFDVSAIKDDGLVCVLNDCLSGPQTPEKAKQASFVALDVRKQRFNSFDLRPSEIEMPSILVLTEFAHWEQKSVNMITSCIDINLVVEDELIVEAFTKFEQVFGVNFYDQISKEQYENNKTVTGIADGIVAANSGKIFRDIKDGRRKSIIAADGRLTVS